MSFSSRLKLDSKLFDSAARKQIFSNAVTRSARDFKESTRSKIVESKPAGRIERREGTRRSFRRSARGQRPAVETTTLINAIEYEQTGDFSAKVDIADKINPKNGESAKDYAEKLQKNLGRKIMTSEDKAEAQENLNRRTNQALIDLL